MKHSNDSWSFIAASEQRIHALELAKRISRSSCPVLIIGPTGVGKEVLAENIHSNSLRNDQRFVAINCASLTASLFENELFGHLRGAYTGALARKSGLVELADGGTLFLDEVGELSLELQAKLLRFLARGTFWPLGATEERTVDVRVVAATNRDLTRMIPTGFREDLFYRLSVIPIVIPALEPADTWIICLELAREITRRVQCAVVIDELGHLATLAAARRWPGGVRELRNVLERYFLLRELGDSVDATWATCCALSVVQANSISTANHSSGALQDNTAEVLRRFDELVFLTLAREARGVRELAARLGRTPQAVYGRMKKLGVSPDAFRGSKLSILLSEARGALIPYRGWIQALLEG